MYKHTYDYNILANIIIDYKERNMEFLLKVWRKQELFYYYLHVWHFKCIILEPALCSKIDFRNVQ